MGLCSPIFCNSFKKSCHNVDSDPMMFILYVLKEMKTQRHKWEGAICSCRIHGAFVVSFSFLLPQTDEFEGTGGLMSLPSGALAAS